MKIYAVIESTAYGISDLYLFANLKDAQEMRAEIIANNDMVGDSFEIFEREVKP